MTKQQLLTTALDRYHGRTVALAKAVGVSKQAIDHWRAGTRDMSRKMLIKFCQLMNVNPDTIIDEKVDAAVQLAQYRTEAQVWHQAYDAMAGKLDKLVDKLDALVDTARARREVFCGDAHGVRKPTVSTDDSQKPH